MFCSTIIPTIGRPTLSRSVNGILNQTFAADNFEVIVVNDSGQMLPEADWQHSDQVQVINTNRRERSVARNTGAAIAQGKYLHFLDDDDWLVPDALTHFWEMTKPDDAGWLYGISQLVDRQENPTIRLQHRLNGNCFVQGMAGEWIPLQSSFIRSDAFFGVGGFNTLITGPEDIDLLRRIALRWDLAETQNIIAYVIRGETGSSTDYVNHPIASRSAREAILSESGVFSRLETSATGAGWRGRIVRIYLTSMIWNSVYFRLFGAISRGRFALLGLARSGTGLFSKSFWTAIAKTYASEAHERGFQEIMMSDLIGSK